MKIFLSVALVLCCFYLGYVISNNIKRKKRFWEDIVKLCEMLSANISFGQKKLREILVDYQSMCGAECSKVLQTFIEEEKVNNIFCKFDNSFFVDGEKKLLSEFFSQVGELDVYNELVKIDNYKIRFTKIYDDYCEKSKKFSPLIVKLSVIFGIVICIVLI